MREEKRTVPGNLSSLVVDYLKNKILAGHYKEGDHVTEVNVAAELGISRAPVREGIRELQNQGLMKSIPRKGNYVARMGLEDVREIFDIRILLENSVLEIIVKENKLSETDFGKLNNIVRDMELIAEGSGEETDKIVAMNQKDMEFHSYLWEKSGSKRREKVLHDLNVQLQMAMVIDTQLTGNLDVTAKDHYEIIRHLQLADLENCKKALRNHIMTYKMEETVEENQA
ncbi:GntR family transcriptional regulator [Desulfosporosinus meridiei]|uniref:Transcriptional regulator n=1 Tax=Desulfosporosinus meridiei (strain ATCC BAA-275 / DSM 13257 / KCTC 12902 / NCIMB 13706 / S10) TaxID=768704 RepID=J7J2M5_DESMD|nr:GntR family transcriptional regulator [Desulfosporosinus meridiei]AFQ45226.1 transcriptional regulator [Desulfosporosinus meridiei DSM 13257]